MMIRLVAGCVVVALWVFCGCAKQEEPSGRLNTVLAHDSGGLPPVPLQRHQSDRLPPISSDRFLAKMGGPASTGSEAEAKPVDTSAPEATSESAEAVELQDDDPQALVEQAIEMERAGNIDVIALMVVPDQREIIEQILVPTKALEAAMKRLLAAVNERDETVGKKLLAMSGGAGGQGPGMALSMGEGPEATVDVEMRGDDRATATIRIDELKFEKKEELERIDDKWRIRAQGLPPIDEVPAAVSMLEKLAKAIGDVTDRLTNDEITVNDVERELGAAMQRAMQEAMLGGTSSGGMGRIPQDPDRAAADFLRYISQELSPADRAACLDLCHGKGEEGVTAAFRGINDNYAEARGLDPTPWRNMNVAQSPFPHEQRLLNALSEWCQENTPPPPGAPLSVTPGPDRPPAPRPPQPPGPNRTRSGRDADNEQPTAEELIGRS